MSDMFEMIMFFIFVGFIGGLAWFNAYSCVKQRKFYLNNSEEVNGTVTSYEKMDMYDEPDMLGMRKKNDPVYILDVDAFNGETYHIETKNRKARKYRKVSDITLLIPNKLDKPYKSIIFEEPSVKELIEKESNGTITPAEADVLRTLRETTAEYEKELNEKIPKKLVIIKEDLKSWFEFGLSIFMGLLFHGFMIFVIVIMIIK